MDTLGELRDGKSQAWRESSGCIKLVAIMLIITVLRHQYICN